MVAYFRRRLVARLVRELMPVFEDMLSTRLALLRAGETADELDGRRIIRAIREEQRRTGTGGTAI